jgi:hypothetical protein
MIFIIQASYKYLLFEKFLVVFIKFEAVNMSSSEFNPDLSDLDQYTSIRDLKPFRTYSIRGVLVDFDENIRRGNGEIELINNFINFCF